MRARRLLPLVLGLPLAALLALATCGSGLGSSPSSTSPARAVSPVIESFAAANRYLSVSSDNDNFTNGVPDVAVKRVSFVPGSIGKAMKVDFSIVGGLWKNVMVEVDKGVPFNFTGQKELDLTMKASYADQGDDQSVTVAMNMLNGALYYQSIALTKQWKTYALKLDPSGKDWGTDGPNWGARDVFTIDKIAYITLFVSPPKTGTYTVWFDDWAVKGAPVARYVNADAPVPREFTSIPYAIGQAVDDMGWRDWDNRRAGVANYQKLLQEHATLADYQTIVNIAKNAGTRLTTVWVMQDLDKNNTCALPKYNTPLAPYDMTSDGLKWTNTVTPDQVQIVQLAKDNAAFMEFGMHGVSHEHYKNGVEQRAEYAHIDENQPGRAWTWGWTDMNLKAECYRDLLRQYFPKDVLDTPVAEVPPAHAYYYSKTDPHTTGALLAKYGVKYVNGGINVSTNVRAGYFIDHGVIFINRAYGTNWDWVGATPWEGYWNDFDWPYYPSDKYGWVEAHCPNLWTAEKKWTAYLLGINNSQNRYLPKNSAQCSWQYLYHKFGTIRGSHGSYTINVSRVDPAAYKYDLLGPMVLKAYVGNGNISKVALTGGARVFGYWKDTFGYAYLLIGKNGTPQGRLDPTTYQMTASFGKAPMSSYVDLNGVTYNVLGFTSGADRASLKIQMYGTQTVKVRLPFRPRSLMSDDPNLTIGKWSYRHGFLRMDVTGKRITGETGTISIAASAAAPAPAWNAVDDFLYLLQNMDLKKMGATRFDLVIMDYSANGHENTRFTPAQIHWLQHSPGGPKRVLAYMSIGEAETYRWYWKKSWDANADGIPDKGAPSWLGLSNPDWIDNYKVRFWDPRWQRLIFGTPTSYLDKVIADGYDGVYLDIIDAYEYWGPGGEGRPVRPTAARDMVNFVRAIAHYARVVKHRPDFAVFPQNGADLGKYPDYMAVVTGIGQEDTWYNDNDKSPWTAENITALKRFKAAGKLVLCTDYCRLPALIDDMYSKAQALGFVPYATVRDLDKLIINPGHAPD